MAGVVGGPMQIAKLTPKTRIRGRDAYGVAPIAAPAPAPVRPYAAPIGGGGGGGSYGGGAPAPAPISNADYLAGDASYQAQLLALQKALGDYQADNTAQQSTYNTQYGNAMKNLGWGIPDDPTTVGVDESNPDAWNVGDLNTAVGRATANQQNDFASRGLLQSSLFGTASKDLLRSLTDQKSSMDTAKSGFLDDLSRQLSGYQSQNKLAQSQAQADAINRRATSF